MVRMTHLWQGMTETSSRRRPMGEMEAMKVAKLTAASLQLLTMHRWCAFPVTNLLEALSECGLAVRCVLSRW